MAGLALAADFELALDAATGTFGILATKGSGKSNAAVVMAEEMWDAGIPWVAIDPKGDWFGVRSSADGKGPGLPIVVFGGRHGDIPLEPTAGAVLADLVITQRLSCVLDVSQFTKAEVTRFLLAFGKHLFNHADDGGAEPLHLFLEEAHEYLPQVVKGDQAGLVEVWQRIVKQGRFKGLGCTMISQRSSVLNKDVLELIDTLVVLRTIGPLSRNAIAAWVKDQDVDPGLLASLPSLVDGEAWVWSPGELRIMRKIRFRRRRTFDSGATPKVGQVRKAPATIADVDLQAIKEAMVSTIERAEANDPKTLRAQVTKLTRRIAQLETELVDERSRVAPEVVTVVPESVDVVRAVLGEIRERVEAAIAVADEAVAARADRSGGDTRGSRQPHGKRDTEGSPAPSRRAVPTRAPSTDSEVTLPKGEASILIAVVQRHDGASRQQLTALTGYKRSTRDAYLQRLSAAGYVEVGPDKRIRATQAGIDALGSNYEPLPVGEDLQGWWLARLPDGEAKILSVLISAWPDGVSRDEISEATGYKRSTRDAYLQRLGAKEIVDVRAGLVFAGNDLF